MSIVSIGTLLRFGMLPVDASLGHACNKQALLKRLFLAISFVELRPALGDWQSKLRSCHLTWVFPSKRIAWLGAVDDSRLAS